MQYGSFLLSCPTEQQQHQAMASGPSRGSQREPLVSYSVLCCWVMMFNSVGALNVLSSWILAIDGGLTEISAHYGWRNICTQNHLSTLHTSKWNIDAKQIVVILYCFPLSLPLSHSGLFLSLLSWLNPRMGNLCIWRAQSSTVATNIIMKLPHRVPPRWRALVWITTSECLQSVLNCGTCS